MRFTQEKLFIDKLGVAVPLPAALGSTLSRESLVSDSPDVVSVDAQGRLVAHRNGDAIVRAANDDGSLAVVVRTTTSLWISPGEIEVVTHGRAPIRLSGERGITIDPDAVSWMTSDPSLAYVDRGKVVAGSHEGRGRLVATYGGLQAEAVVVVRSPRISLLAFRFAPSRIHRGEVVHFQLSETVPDSRWTTSNPRVLAAVAPGLFQARSRGRSRVCAWGRSGAPACSNVEVIK